MSRFPEYCSPGLCHSWNIHGAQHWDHFLRQFWSQWHDNRRWRIVHRFLGWIYFWYGAAIDGADSWCSWIHWSYCKFQRRCYIGINGWNLLDWLYPNRKGRMDWYCTWRFAVRSNAKSSYASCMANWKWGSNCHIFPLLIVRIFARVSLKIHIANTLSL